MNKQIGTKELAEIICKAIEDEPYFTKEVLIPKIKMLITAFRLRLSATTYGSIEKPTDKDKLVRANELLNREINFWKEQLRNTVGKENMQPFYNKQVKRREKYNKEQFKTLKQ